MPSANLLLKKYRMCLVLFFLATGLVSAQTEETGPPLSATHLKFVGGMVIPTGDFSSSTGTMAGLAKTGFGFGAEVTKEAGKFFEYGIVGTLNVSSMDGAAIESQFRSILGTNAVTVDAGSWVLVSALGTAGFNVEVSPTTRLYGKSKLGLMHGKSPELNFIVNGTGISQNSASSTAVSFGFGLGVILSEKFDIGLHYFTSEPEYEVTVQGGGNTVSGKFKQPTSVFQLMVGYVIALD